MEPETKKIAMIVHNYFEQPEMEEVRNLLQDSGHEVDLIAPERDEVQALRGVQMGDSFDVDRQLEDVRPDDYDAVVLPGGAFNADQLRIVTLALDFVEAMHNQDKPVAAICHAPWVLVSLGMVAGRTVTSYPTLRDDIQNASGNWVDQSVAQDGLIITSRNPDDIADFCKAIDDSLAA